MKDIRELFNYVDEQNDGIHFSCDKDMLEYYIPLVICKFKDSMWRSRFGEEAKKVIIDLCFIYNIPFTDLSLHLVEDHDNLPDEDYNGFADDEGNIIINCSSFNDDLSLFSYGDGKKGYIDKSGKLAIPCQWEDADHFSEGLAGVADSNCLWGFIDKTGKLVIPYKWKDIDYFEEGLARVADDSGKYGFINKEGTLVIPCKWKIAFEFVNNKANVMDEKGNWLHIDKFGNII